MRTKEETAADRRRETRVPAGSSSARQARERLVEALPVTERRLELTGVATPVLEGGEGRPVVLLHGPGEHSRKWLGVIPDLAVTHRVVAPDLPGHGDSEIAGDRPLDAARVLSWLGELIARTCASPPVLVGQIVGGAIAARFASEDGGRIDRLVLVDALGLAPFDPAPEFGAALSEFMETPTEESHDRLWRHCASDLDGLQERLGERWRWLKTYNIDRARSASVSAAVQGLMGAFGFPAIPEEELERIDVPTTLIWGRHDLATRLHVAEAASERYGWPLHVIEDSGDDPPLERPEAFVETLRRAMNGS